MSGELWAKSVQFDNADFDLLAQAILRRGFTLRFRAMGTSMHPLVCHGDVLYVQAVPAGTVVPGDVILFRKDGGRMLVHRVLRRDESGGSLSYLVKGDRVSATDGMVPFENVLGKVVAYERDGTTVDLGAVRWRLLGRVVAHASPHWRPLLFAARRLQGIAAAFGWPGAGVPASRNEEGIEGDAQYRLRAQ